MTNDFDREVLTDRQESLKRQLQSQYKTLWHLEEQKAKFGISTPPHIAIGIEDAQAEIERLEAEVQKLARRLGQSSGVVSPPPAGEPEEARARKREEEARSEGPTVFVSYHRADEQEKEALVKQLKVLSSVGLIDVWSEDEVTPGSEWAAEIDRAIDRARVAVLLISPDFLASREKLGEVRRLLERRQQEGLVVIPIIARYCAWDELGWLAQMRVRPASKQPVWRNGGIYADEELSQIAREIAAIIEQ